MDKVDKIIEDYDSSIESLTEEIEECEEVLFFLNASFSWLEDIFKFKKTVSLSAKGRGWFVREGEKELSDAILANMIYGIERQKKMAEADLNDCKKWRDEELAKTILEVEELEE